MKVLGFVLVAVGILCLLFGLGTALSAWRSGEGLAAQFDEGGKIVKEELDRAYEFIDEVSQEAISSNRRMSELSDDVRGSLKDLERNVKEIGQGLIKGATELFPSVITAVILVVVSGWLFGLGMVFLYLDARKG